MSDGLVRMNYITKDNTTWMIDISGRYTTAVHDYLINDDIPEAGVDRIIQNAAKVLGYCPNPAVKKKEQNTGIVIGRVQSGKTSNYICMTALALDNDYKIVIIEDQNPGGYSELCLPFTQYTRPKIAKPTYFSGKSTNIFYTNFFLNDENLNSDTCLTYTEKDDILNGKEDKYSEDIVHKRTKPIDILNIYEKKIMEEKRRAYLKTGKAKKPTETIVFTDDFSFSCSSAYVKGLQIHQSPIPNPLKFFIIIDK